MLSIAPNSCSRWAAHLKLQLLLALSKRNVGSFELLRPADPRARKAAEQPEDAHQQAASADSLAYTPWYELVEWVCHADHAPALSSLASE